MRNRQATGKQEAFKANKLAVKPFFRLSKMLPVFLSVMLGYLVALAVLLPAGFVWKQVEPYVTLPENVRVTGFFGAWWDGAAAATIHGYPARLQWRVGMPQMTAGLSVMDIHSLSDVSLPITWSLDTAQSDARGDVSLVWPNVVRGSGAGRVVVSEFESLIRQSGGAMLNGTLAVRRLDFELHGDRVVKAQGVGEWPGGRVSWLMAGESEQATLPAMMVSLDSTARGLEFIVAAKQGEGAAAQVSLTWGGMMNLQVHKRMLDLAGQKWPITALPDDVVFRVRQPLIPGAY
jgi:general secretion pathway protein N